MGAIVQSLTELLKIESIVGNEARLCTHVEELLRERFKSAASPPRIERVLNSLVISSAFDSLKSTLLLAGHLDTVAGTETGELVRVLSDRIIGLGASDMKAGVAVMLELLKPELLQQSRFNLMFIFYSREEGPHEENELHTVLREFPELSRANFCFVLEPTDNSLHLGCMGTIHAQIVFKGQRAHSARPWQGRNAIHAAAEFLSQVSKIPPRTVTLGGLDFKEVYSVTTANSGDNSRNVIPDYFELNLNYRFPPNLSAAAAKQHVVELVAGQAAIQFLDVSPACPVPESNPILREFEARFNLPRWPKQAYTDVALFAEHGINAVNFGPGLTAQAHQRGEYVRIQDLEQSLEIYRSFISR
ncbi:MAG: succinyl-diaminopimelate desuccinylase [Oligoflexia bacterium]|nr:succinyl-diaminopimelate desuccinylase [Oligoflexia bacterium]